MELRIHSKAAAILTAAAIAGCGALTALIKPWNVSAVTDEQQRTQAVMAVAEYSKPSGSDAQDDNGEYEVSAWWKADLSDYSDELAVVSYETVEVPTEAPTEPEEDNGIVINDTGISYIEPDSDYEAIQIVPEIMPEEPIQRPDAEPVDVEPGNFVFTTYGYGHGVGMSQNGANHYATYSGWNYQQILGHYYPGTYLQNTGIKEDAEISAGGVTGKVLDIVSMVTYNEVGGSMSNEAIRAQAVAVYTYIMYKGGNAPDLYPKANPPQNVIDAVKSVYGEALYYDGSFALSMFSASSGGSSASCYDIFYQDIPYLRSVPCEYDSSCDPHYGTATVISAAEVKLDLESCLGITLSDDPNNWVSIIEGDGGYAAYVVVDGQVTVKGNDFRGYLGLKSPKFTVEYN